MNKQGFEGAVEQPQSIAFSVSNDGVVKSVEQGPVPFNMHDLPSVGDDLTQWMQPSDVDAFVHSLSYLHLKDGNRLTLRCSWRRADNWWVHVNIAMTATSPDAVRLDVALDDFDKARQEENQLFHVIAAAGNGVVVVGEDGVVFMNRGLAELLGYNTIDELIADPNSGVATQVHQDDLPLLIERIEAKKRGDLSRDPLEVRIIARDRSITWTEMRIGAIDWNGENCSLIWITEINRRKHAESKLLETMDSLVCARNDAIRASQAKTEFLAKMSHEIRTPLNGIQMASRLLKNDGFLPAESANMASIIDKSCTNLSEIVGDILDISKIEAGNLRLRRSLFSVSTLSQEIADHWSLQMLEKGLDFSVVADDVECTDIFGDPVRTRQIVDNLVSNALKYTDDGQVRVTLSTNRIGERVTFQCEVEDTGVGIAPERMNSIFEPFDQADPEEKQGTSGAGLGLAICTQLASMMGGEVVAQSEFGRGSRFRFAFDYDVDRALQATVATPDSYVARNPELLVRGVASDLKILVAEDHGINREVMKGLLDDVGVAATFVVNGQEALDACLSQDFDLVFMDIRMPEMDGLTATRRVRAEIPAHRQPVIVALSASALEEDVRKAMDAGVDRYIPKPLDLEVVVDCIRRTSRLVGKSESHTAA